MFHRLLDQIQDILMMAIAALIFGILKVLMMPNGQPVKVYISSLVASVPVGTLAGALCLELGVPDIASISCASLASVLAHDLLYGIMKNTDTIGGLLKRASENLIDKWTK